MNMILQSITKEGRAAGPDKIRILSVNRGLSINRLALSTLLAAAVCVMPGTLARAKAGAEVASKSCGSPQVYAFPNAAVSQGTTVTIFVTETNETATSNPFIVSTTAVAPNGSSVVVIDSRVVNLGANGGTTSYAISLPTTSSTVPGIYTVTAESYQGSELPAVTSDFCSSAQTTVKVVCSTNDCPAPGDGN